MATGKALDGKPYAGNPHVRFDEGEVAPAATPRRGSLLYKKLLIALAAAATAVVASAEIKNQLGFEGADGTPYANDAPSGVAANYPFADFGSKYLELDESYTPDAKGGNILDMYIQFVACDEAYSLGEGEKLGVYVDKDGYLVVVGRDKEPAKTDIQISGWHRLTVVPSGTADFYVYVDGVKVQDEPFAGAGDDNSISEMEFKGSGKLDNFVARTTDPFAARGERAVAVGEFATGGEYFTDVSDEAIAAAAAAGLPLKLYGNAALTATLNAGDSFTLIKGGYELTGLGDKYTVNGNTYTRVSAWSDYLGDAVAGAYEIDNLAELKAFQANVDTLPTANLTFKLTADIALDAAWPGIGIQNGKDLVTSKTAADVKAFDDGAFCGTFDGQNHTISGFQMVGVAGNPASTTEGLDYCGFFNSTYGATIKNLKIAYAGSLFATDTTASTKESGATFVGVAKNSTLQNLTSLEGTVSCSKGFGGIVGYLMGSAVESCTNNVNLTSLAKNKCGGIAMICQQANCSISNCKNNGTITTESGEHGGIIGYTDTITISDCENTAACKMFYHHGGTVTLSGANKGNATVASYTGVATPGLNFAKVDGNVATFVADNALAAGNTYNVMAPNATATYAFGDAGEIAFDTSLYTPTYAITAAETLVLAVVENDNTTTYTAAPPVVAKIGDTPYASLADAVAAAKSGDTVKLVANVTLATRVEPTKSMTIDLGGYTVTPTATCANGSAFDVKSGTVTIKNGAIDGSAITEIECDPITARSGSDVTLEGLTITICSQNGACAYPFIGAKMTIKSGTYKNTTVTPYQYKQGWTGMAVNQGNTATQLLFIEGGSFAQVNPALGDDSWAEGAGTFLAKGYVSTYDDVNGVWVVSEQKGFPGGADGKSFTIDGEVTLPAGKALTDTASAATGLTYAQAAVLGLLDEEGALKEDVTPTIEVKNGKVVVSLDGTAVDATRYTVMLNVYEKANLTDNWPATPTKIYQIGSAEDAAFTPVAGGSRFYKVGVTIEDYKSNN